MDEEQGRHAHAVTLRKKPAAHILEEQLAHWDVSEEEVPEHDWFRKKPLGQDASDVKLHALHCKLSQMVHAADL